MPEYQWHTAVAFAEFAEVLCIRTDQIMAVMNPHSDGVTVLYTPGDDSLIFSARMRRDEDGVLRLAGRKIAHPGMWEEIVRQAEVEIPKRLSDAGL